MRWRSGMVLLLLLAGCAHGETASSDDDPDASAPSDAPPAAIDVFESFDVLPPPDAAVPLPDAAMPRPDAAVPDASLPHPDAAIPHPDAALPDASLPHPDASLPHPDASLPHPDAALPPPDASVPPPVVMFANNESTLYRIDASTFASTQVAAFVWPASVGVDAMADLAIAPDGKLIGVSGSRLYQVNPANAHCTLLGSISPQLNALTYVPVGVLDPNVEVLVGAGSDGKLYKLNPTSGATTLLGHYSSGHSSSGDLAYLPGTGLVATVNPGGSNDALAKVTPTTGATALVGSTGLPWVWGLANVHGTLVGFTLSNTIVSINVSTGASTTLATGPIGWYGAAAR